MLKILFSKFEEFKENKNTIPKNLRIEDNVLKWDALTETIQYRINFRVPKEDLSSITHDVDLLLKRPADIYTTKPFWMVPIDLESHCFFWRVQAYLESSNEWGGYSKVCFYPNNERWGSPRLDKISEK